MKPAFKFAGAIGVPITALALMAAAGQPPAPTAPTPAHANLDRPASQDGEWTQWHEHYRKELQEHPRIAHALIELHRTREYLEKAPHDFGGHKAAAVKQVDEAIKQLHAALKFDAKQESGDGDKPQPERPAERPRRHAAPTNDPK
jgi:hypothetical protein